MAEEGIADFSVNIDAMDNARNNTNSGLSVQSAENLDVNTITPLSKEVISRQATLNIGTIGHVAHGKSTVVGAISNVHTQRHSSESKTNATIYLGYANAKIYKVPDKEGPGCYKSFGSDHPDIAIDIETGKRMELLRHVSFLDCPGHDVLMATMLNGAAIMDAALLLIAANEPFPQPQTLEHLKAVEIMKLTSLIVLQNKIDLVKLADAQEQRKKIVSYFDSSVGLTCPILPISAQLKYNIDALIEYIINIPIPVRQLKCPVRMIVVRSFDVNKPGDINELRGGVAGGSVLKGILKLGQEVEFRPGHITKNESGQFICRPYRTKIVTLLAERNDLQYAIPGGLIATGTKLDPSLTRNNKLVGQLMGDVGSLPNVYSIIDIDHTLMTTLVASAGATGGKNKSGHNIRVAPLSERETIQVNIGTLTVAATVMATVKQGHRNIARLKLNDPACCTVRGSGGADTDSSAMITISRRIDASYRLIGWGIMERGIPVQMLE